VKIVKNRKLFGVLNILDVFIIIFILLIIIPALHYYIKFNEMGFAEQKILERYLKRYKMSIDASRTKQDGITELYVSFKDLTKEELEKIKVRDKENLSDGTTLAEIVWIGEPEPNYYFIKNLRIGQTDYPRAIIDDGLYSLPARVMVRGCVNREGFFYKARPVSALSRITFDTGDYKADFVVETFPFKKF